MTNKDLTTILEKLQKLKQDPVELGEWLMLNADTKTMRELMTRFIDEILPMLTDLEKQQKIWWRKAPRNIVPDYHADCRKWFSAVERWMREGEKVLGL